MNFLNYNYIIINLLLKLILDKVTQFLLQTSYTRSSSLILMYQLIMIVLVQSPLLLCQIS